MFRFRFIFSDVQNMTVTPESIFDVVGQAGITRLVRNFYEQVPGDEILGPMYPADALSEAEHRLLGFLTYRFGGPDSYLAERGNPRLRMRHAPFVIDQAARDRWMTLMSSALQNVDFSPEVRATLAKFFDETATFLINHH